MSPDSASDVIIRIDSIDQLFKEPDIDPLSNKPAVVVGAAALPFAVREGLSRGLGGWKGKRLVIQLPPEQISPDTPAVVAHAVRCYSAAKIEENNARVRISRLRGLIAFGIAILIAVVVLLVLAMLFNGPLASASDAVKGLAAGIATIFIWATIWNPVDRLVFEWVEPWLENRILRTIASMEIFVQAESA